MRKYTDEELTPPDTYMQRKFLAHHAANPVIYGLLMKYANIAQKSGFDSYSINGIFERVRWHVTVDTTDGEYKMNNDFRSRYVRRMMKDHPHLNGFFEIRALTS